MDRDGSGHQPTLNYWCVCFDDIIGIHVNTYIYIYLYIYIYIVGIFFGVR